MMIHCIIIDDEPPARRVLSQYIEKVQFLKLHGAFSNAMDALPVLKAKGIQLIFLDIQMPTLSGIQFLRTLNDPPLVIFTTAFSEHAVDGFELKALDYLLKPFSFERFLKAVGRAYEHLELLQKNGTSTKSQYLIIKADKKIHRIHQDDILYLQAFGDYVRIFTKQSTHTPKARLNEIEQSLPKDKFIRIHRSYIVALNAIQYIEGNRVILEAQELPVSASYKNDLIKQFEKS